VVKASACDYALQTVTSLHSNFISRLMMLSADRLPYQYQPLKTRDLLHDYSTSPDSRFAFSRGEWRFRFPVLNLGRQDEVFWTEISFETLYNVNV